MRQFFKVLALAACALIALPAAHRRKSIFRSPPAARRRLLPVGGGMANVLSKHVPGMSATAEVTGGSVANLQLIGTGKPYIALSMTDAALDAYKGVDKFKDKKTDVRTLMILYPNRMHVVSIEGMGINSMKDMKGKRVSTGSPAARLR